LSAIIIWLLWMAKQMDHALVEGVVKFEFYDVKTRKKVESEVIDKVVYGQGRRRRYAFRAKTPDGRNLTKFVGKPEWDWLRI
jgi:hypothetical protein